MNMNEALVKIWKETVMAYFDIGHIIPAFA
jgi:hypothetical protein